MGRNKAKHDRDTEQEVEDTPDNDLVWSDDEDSKSESTTSASIHDGIEILRLLADYGYDVKGKLVDGNMQFLFRSKVTQGSTQKHQGNGEHRQKLFAIEGAPHSDSMYGGGTPAPPEYTESRFRDDRNGLSKKRASRCDGIAAWMRT